MPDDFDPYYQWLSIGPEEQPPTLYRLLGLRPFEDNPKVIETAADRQAAYLRSVRPGEHRAESQRLLEEVAAARTTLLEPRKKAEYDKLLREQENPVVEADTDQELSVTLAGFLQGIEAEKDRGPQTGGKKAEKKKTRFGSRKPGTREETGGRPPPDDFDPYETWLAIEPEEQPPTLYRLLGLRPLEDNRDLIKTAAGRQSDYIRKFVSGEHGAEAQRMLGEVAAARSALLSKRKKTKYDKLLSGQMKRQRMGEQEDEGPGAALAGFLQSIAAEEEEPSAKKESKPAEKAERTETPKRGEPVIHVHTDQEHREDQEDPELSSTLIGFLQAMETEGQVPAAEQKHPWKIDRPERREEDAKRKIAKPGKAARTNRNSLERKLIIVLAVCVGVLLLLILVVWAIRSRGWKKGTPRPADIGRGLAVAPDAYFDFDHYNGSTVYNRGTAAGKDGTLCDGATITPGGKFGKGMSIADDSKQRLEVPDGVDIGSEWTIAAWFYHLHDASHWRTLSRGKSTDHHVIVGQQGSHDLGIYMSGDTGSGFCDCGYDLNYTTNGKGWHHIAAVGSKGTTKLYLDGVYVGTSGGQSTSEVTWIGNHSSGQPFASVIDEFVVYGVALDAGQIATLYSSGISLPAPCTPPAGRQ